jgi:hypothetical protein
MQQRKILTFILLLALSLTTAGCYTAEVVTGKPASSQTIEKPWATGFIAGLIGPGQVDASQECGDAGVSRVMTQQSFLNMLVTGITFNLYSPMTIMVTCAEGGAMSDNVIRSESRSDEHVKAALQEAAERSQSIEAPVYVQLAE